MAVDRASGTSLFKPAPPCDALYAGVWHECEEHETFEVDGATRHSVRFRCPDYSCPCRTMGARVTTWLDAEQIRERAVEVPCDRSSR